MLAEQKLMSDVDAPRGGSTKTRIYGDVNWFSFFPADCAIFLCVINNAIKATDTLQHQNFPTIACRL